MVRNTVLPKIPIFFTGNLKNHIKVYQNKISQYWIQIINEPLFLFLFQAHINIRQQFGCLLKCLKCRLYRLLASFKNVIWRHLECHLTSLRPEGPSAFNRWLRRYVTSSDVASYRRCGHVLTSWTSIGHRKQMWCQTLIKL